MPLQRKVSGVPFTRGKMLKGPLRRQGERKPRSFGARVTTCRILKVRDGLCYEKCFLGGIKGLKSERWGPLPGRGRWAEAGTPACMGCAATWPSSQDAGDSSPFPQEQSLSSQLPPPHSHFSPFALPPELQGTAGSDTVRPLILSMMGREGNRAGRWREDSHGEGRAESCPHLPWPLGPCAGSPPAPKKPNRSRPPAGPPRPPG